MQPLIRRPQRGQALPEFALVAPLFFLLIFAVIQLGLLFGGQIALTNATREVARYASTVAPNQSNGAITSQATPILQRGVPAYIGGTNVTVTSSYCYYANPTSPATYSWKVIVSIRYGHALFIPLVGAILDRFDGTADNRLTVTAREEMRVETLPMKNPPVGTLCSGVNP